MLYKRELTMVEEKAPTERKRAEKALQASEERLFITLKSVGGTVVVANTKGEI